MKKIIYPLNVQYIHIRRSYKKQSREEEITHTDELRRTKATVDKILRIKGNKNRNQTPPNSERIDW